MKKFTLKIFGLKIIEVTLKTTKETEEPETRYADHTGYLMGFTPPPTPPHELTCPDRDF